MGRSNRQKSEKARSVAVRGARARSKRELPIEHPELDVAKARMGFLRTETKRGVEYSVQPTAGVNAEQDKTWICPHCSLQITRGTAHLVAWDAVRGVETRRHFHSNCWKAFQGPLL